MQVSHQDYAGQPSVHQQVAVAALMTKHKLRHWYCNTHVEFSEHPVSDLCVWLCLYAQCAALFCHMTIVKLHTATTDSFVP